MFTHHEHQSLGQDKSASPTVTTERCIPIKRRWLQKFDPSKGNRSSQPDCSSRSSSSGGVFSETELPDNHFYEVEQSEAIDLTRPRKLTSGHRLANQVSSKKVSLATNSNRSLYKRGFDTQSQGLLGDRSLKRFRHSSTSLQANQLTGTSYRLPSAVQARNSFGILASDQPNPRKYKEQDNSQTDFKLGSIDRQAQARQQLQYQKPILEQCLRGFHVGSFPERPTVRNVLRHQDHTKLSIGERTELDKMRDEEISAKYFNANFEKQPECSELLHLASSVRRKAGASSMMFGQDTHWNGLDSQGLSISSSADALSRSYGTTSGTTTSSQHQPYQSQSETYHNSKMPQDVVRLENNMSTITVNELFNLAGVAQEFMSQDQIPSLSTDDQFDHLHQMGNGSMSIASKVDSRLENLKQPKAELMDDGLPACQRSNGQFHHQPGAEISGEVSEHLHVIEEVVSQNRTKVVKTEADSCTLPTNRKSLTPMAVTKREPGSGTKKPLDGKCPICTDVISGYHYGTHSCESCKGFFKRTIQNKRNERLACALIGNCVINLQNRKHCASCRFKKCLESGMKQEAVREDRQRGGRSMYEGSSEQQRRQHLQLQQEQKGALGQVKKRKPRKRASSTTTQPPDEDGDNQNLQTTTRLSPQQTLRLSNPTTSCPVPATSMITLTPSMSSRSSESSDEGHHYLKTLESLEATFFNPFGLPRISVDRTDSEKSLLTGAYYLMDYFCKKMPQWIETIPFLQDLEVFDRSVLLKANWLQVLVLTVCFRCHNNEGYLILPDRSTCDMMNMVSSVGIQDIARRMKQLAQKFQALKTTQDEYFYLKLLILLNPDVKNLSQPSRIRSFQETVQEHLFEHGMAKEGNASGMKIGELLLKLSELQRLSHLIKEHLVFTQVAGQLGPRSYCNLENMLDD